MTPEKLLEIMGEIDEKYIEEADPSVKNNIIKINFGALAGIAAGVLAIAVVSNYMIDNYWRNSFEPSALGTSTDSAPEECEEYAEQDAAYSNNTGDTNDETNIQGFAAQGKRSVEDNAMASAAAENAMPEAAYEAEEDIAEDSKDSGENINDRYFTNGAGFSYFDSTPEAVLIALRTEVTKLNADTPAYFYITENSEKVLSPEYVRENIIKNFSPEALESDNCIYYITQHKDDVLIGYIAIAANGDILDNRLEG